MGKEKTRRRSTTIALSEDERKLIDEYADLSGMEDRSKVIRHFTVPAVDRELPELRERHRRRMEALGTP